MSTIKQNYSYANNSDGILVNVSTAQRKNQYFCPICGRQMIPHMGNKRRWHFVHKNSENCSYESYLHCLAKHKIREAFLSTEPFYITYNAKAICGIKCPYVDYPKCTGVKTVKFDLRTYYDTCEIETTYHNFRADLLLTSSSHPKRSPILLEIKVTHECTQEKINDGVRIIEIPIYSEAHIENIVKNRILKGTRNGSYNGYSAIAYNDSEPVIFYNFDKVEQFDPRENASPEWEDIFYRKDTIVFCVDRNGHFEKFDCHCYEVESKAPKDVHYFITKVATPYKEIFQGFSKRGVKIRNCFLCKFSQKDFYGSRVCVLYKRFNLPRTPYPYTALDCLYYKEDFEAEELTTPEPNANQDVNSRQKSHYHICNNIL